MRLTKPRIEPLPEAEWNDEVRGLLEPSRVVFTVGQYDLVSMALNTFGVQLDDGVEGS